MKMSLLQQMYKDVLAGIPLAKENCYYASFLTLCIEQSPEGDESCDRMHLPSTEGGIRSRQDDMSDTVGPTADDVSHDLANMNFSSCPREVMLLQLTLIKMLVDKAESQETEFSTRQKYCEILVLLLKEPKISSKLVSFYKLLKDFCKRGEKEYYLDTVFCLFFLHLQSCLLSSRDQLLSHMASKSLASLVYFQLKEEVSIISHCLKNNFVNTSPQVVPFTLELTDSRKTQKSGISWNYFRIKYV